MDEQLTFSLEPVSSSRQSAETIHQTLCDALSASGRGYDLSLIQLTHIKTKSKKTPIEYDMISIGKESVFRFQGVKTVYMYIKPRLEQFFADAGLPIEHLASSWPRIPADSFSFAGAEELAELTFEEVLRDSGFGCCSRYVECSDAGHCIHPDIMFAVQCAYRENLRKGRIFYGKNKTI